MNAGDASSPEEIKKIAQVRAAVFRNPQADAFWRRVSEEETGLRYDWLKANGVTPDSPEGGRAFMAYVDRTDARMAWKFYDTLPPRIQELVRELYPAPPSAEFLPQLGNSAAPEQRAV